jgi:hypothetical protein
MSIKVLTRALFLIFVSLHVAADGDGTMNGFDLSNLTVDRGEILAGGPPRDGIPAIDAPGFVAAQEVNYLRDEDIVVGLVRGARARAYPLRILVWHEIVNDTFDGEPLAVTYCPLCGTAMVFDRRAGGRERSFGVSGLLYRSDVLMYDRETGSLWSQLAMESVSGPAAGARLVWLPSEHMTWQAWRQRYPDSEVLSPDTGFRRDYGGTPYASYFASDEPMFPVPKSRTELPDRALVVGTIVGGEAKAYPVEDLRSVEALDDHVGGTPVVVRYDADSRRPEVSGPEGEQLPSVVVFWFAWQGFYPETGL